MIRRISSGSRHSLLEYQHDWGRPAIDWNEIVTGIKQYGIRNAAQTTVAPTGTIATVAGLRGLRLRAGLRAGLHPHVVKDGDKATHADVRQPLV